MTTQERGLAVLGAWLMGAAGCTCEHGLTSVSEDGRNASVVTIQGAGATCSHPLYSKWISEYHKEHPNVRINCQSIGSGGIRQIAAGTVDFGATDVPVAPSEAAKAHAELQHLPVVLGAVTVTYNVGGVFDGLKLKPATLVDIYRGRITRWDDVAIAHANPRASLPTSKIAVVHRSDGSGTTAVFTDYLARVEPAWKHEVGVGKSVQWPVGLGAKGDEGMTGQVRSTPGAIGYVELAYALQNHMPVVALENRAGRFVKPSIRALADAAAAHRLSDGLCASITDSSSAGAYPMASFSYIVVLGDIQDRKKGEELLQFLWWAVHDGQRFSEPLHYAPLPARVVAKVEARLKLLKAGGQRVLAGPD